MNCACCVSSEDITVERTMSVAIAWPFHDSIDGSLMNVEKALLDHCLIGKVINIFLILLQTIISLPEKDRLREANEKLQQP